MTLTEAFILLAAGILGGLAGTVAGVASVGSASAFSTVIDGHKVTAVGEVPPATVRFIASSVKRSDPPLAVGSAGH